jgi:hypothetical protein
MGHSARALVLGQIRPIGGCLLFPMAVETEQSACPTSLGYSYAAT